MNNYFDFSSEDFLMITTFKNDTITDEENFQSILKYKNLNKNFVAFVEQVHSNNISTITDSGTYPNSDGLITSNSTNLILVIKTADCIPIFIYDNLNGNYGIIHAGWKGIIKKIHINMIRKFISMDSKIENLNVILGPSIKSCCYEVGQELADMFGEECIKKYRNKIYLDINKYVISDLKDFGVIKIKGNEVCSFENYNCHSYRRDSEKSGRMYSFIAKI